MKEGVRGGTMGSPTSRWATFDCYGTLIDWNGGIAGELARLFGVGEVSRLLDRYHEVEPQVQAEDPERTYRTVLTLTLERLAEGEKPELPDGEHDALVRSLPAWTPFPEVPEALEEARGRGWRLAILSNTDRDFIEASKRQIGVPFDVAIVASEIGSYKPALGHWQAFEREVSRLPDAHVGASHFHDVVPASGLGLPTVWVNRLAERADPSPTREIRDLTALADALDELVPA